MGGLDGTGLRFAECDDPGRPLQDTTLGTAAVTKEPKSLPGSEEQEVTLAESSPAPGSADRSAAEGGSGIRRSDPRAASNRKHGIGDLYRRPWSGCSHHDCASWAPPGHPGEPVRPPGPQSAGVARSRRLHRQEVWSRAGATSGACSQVESAATGGRRSAAPLASPHKLPRP